MRGVRGHERRGVDDIGEMGEWSHAGLCRGGSRRALGWKGSMLRIGPELECGWNEGGSPFTYTTSCWGVESSREGSPDSNVGSYQPVPTTDLSALGPHIHIGKVKRVLQPLTHTPSPPLLPTCKQPMLPYSGFIRAEWQSRRKLARKGALHLVQSSCSSLPGLSRDPLLSPEKQRSLSPLEYAQDKPMGSQSGVKCHERTPRSPDVPRGRLSARNFYGFKFRLLTRRDSHVHSFSHRNRPIFRYHLYF